MFDKQQYECHINVWHIVNNVIAVILDSRLLSWYDMRIEAIIDKEQENMLMNVYVFTL